MGTIQVLDQLTINKIAAGEVVERPVSVVKELVENSIDAGATMVAVEIKDGGISMIRVSDNGGGIEAPQIGKAFLRHATSKIQNADDLLHIRSLGFRGEALSSIAAVSQVELITKTKDAMTGVRVLCNGGVLEEAEEVGAPDGTTIIVRNIFFNTPVRRNFLRASITEASYVTDVMQRLALSRPDIAFKFIINGQTRFFTSGNNDMNEVIYNIYGNDITNQMIHFEDEQDFIKIDGFIGMPSLNRSNRSYENFFVNGRYVKSVVISDAVEEGYRHYLMQHKYPFVILRFTIDTEQIDVNVHPTKMDIRFAEPEEFVRFTMESIQKALKTTSLIPDARLSTEKPLTAKEIAAKQKLLTKQVPEPFETKRPKFNVVDKADYYVNEDQKEIRRAFQGVTVSANDNRMFDSSVAAKEEVETTANTDYSEIILQKLRHSDDENTVVQQNTAGNVIKQSNQVIVEKHDQMELFGQTDFVTDASGVQYEILGQLFKTYWLLALQDKLYILDQHAAHEKINYEAMVKNLNENTTLSQMIMPCVVVSLNDREYDTYIHYKSVFDKMGFEVDAFGGNEFTIRSIPTNLYGSDPKELFLTTLDQLVDFSLKIDPTLIYDRIAAMACKAAVKGNTELSRQEAKALVDTLFTLDNPYVCPHGRPTIIAMSKYEIDKKFKRIL